jgi:hypothetical protein
VADNSDEDVLTYRGQVWAVESEPEVIDRQNGSELIEVWVRRGEGIEQPSEG